MEQAHPVIEADQDVVAVLQGKSTGRRRAWIAGGALLAVVAAVALGVRALGGGAPVWETAEVRRGVLVEKVTAVGTLQPMDSVTVGSDLSGRVEAVLVDANATVSKGQVLARLDPTPFRNTVDQAKAQLAAARATLAQALVKEHAARLDAERKARLLERGAATGVDEEDSRLALEQATASKASAEAEVALRRAALTDAETDLAKTVITSPIDGVVTGRLVDPGQTVVSAMSATTLFTVASDLQALRAEVDIDEADVGKVLAGQTSHFTVSTWPDRTFEAEVARVDLAPQEQADVVTYEARLLVRNDDLALRPGLTATAEIEVGRLEDVLLVPSVALRIDVDGSTVPGEHVWVLEGEAPREVPVTVLGMDGMSAAIRADGVAPGSRVLVGRVE